MVFSYFSDRYHQVQYPVASEGKLGLRNAQLGAIHAISSFFTLNKRKAAIVVMPTGSGKTTVIMMAPYVLCANKVLVVTPSKLVRGQITEEFEELKTPIKVGVFDQSIEKPKVYEMIHLYGEESVEPVRLAQVIVATPACALSLTEHDEAKKLIDLVIIDEAHHVPARTWRQILLNMNYAKQLLFTATPFRMDRKEIVGELIYNYPLSLAYRDGIFGEIEYIPVQEADDKDILIAKKAESVLLSDREKGFDHYIMVRTNSKKKAKCLQKIYEETTALNLKRIDSSMTYSTIKKCISDLRQKTLDGIICVDMLGEGFDFPNLKIAAIHDPHKSLANTLQFIGRFARTNASHIGSAKFISMNDNELLIENKALYRSDAIWQEMIINLSEKKIYEEEIEKEYISHYHLNKTADSINSWDFSLYNVRPNCHAKIYKAEIFNLNAEFPDICNIKLGPYINEQENTVIAVGEDKISPKWLMGDSIKNIQNMLYVVHYQEETKLFFIYSQTKSDIIYEEIAKAFCSQFEKTSKHEMHRVLGNLQEFEIYSSGMQNRFNESGESYRISTGADVSQAIDPSSGRLYSAGHVFCKATMEETAVTIGYSSGSKLWSSTYAPLSAYVRWCDINGLKISNSEIVVRTNTNYDYLPIPQRLREYPTNIFMCDLAGETYSNPPSIYFGDSETTQGTIIDLLIEIEKIDKDYVALTCSINGTKDSIICDTNGKYRSLNSKIKLSTGRDRIGLPEYLNDYPLIYRTTDDVMIQGIEYCSGNPDAIVFSNENIISIDWNDYGTDIKVEVDKSDLPHVKSIQSTVCELLKQDHEYEYIIFDHSTGEIADFITVSNKKDEYEIAFYHVKKMSAENYNSSMTDIYEVTGQAVKSIIWLKTKSVFLNKIADRRRSGHANFIKGDYETFRTEIKSLDKRISGKIIIVQPSISKGTNMPEKMQEVLAATQYYIRNSGKIKSLEIWGSY